MGEPAFLRFMKRFQFTLQSIRELRDERQSSAMLVLAARVRVHQAAQLAAEARLDRHRRSEIALRDAVGAGPVSARTLVQADADRNGARLTLEQAAATLSESAFAVDGARRDLVEAERNVEMLRRLEDRQREAHRIAAARAEERDLADVIEARSARAATEARRRVRRAVA
jgi:flagellar export protein FliJ